MWVKFQQLSIYSKKSGKCICGKRITRKKKFSSTASPFNKKENGEIKTHEEIYNELRIKADKWNREPIRHTEFGHDQYCELSKEDEEKYNKGEPVNYKMSCGYTYQYSKEGGE